MEQTYSYFISQLVTQTPLFCTPGLKDLVRSPDPSCDVSVIECNFHSAPSRNHFSIPQGYATIVISNFYYVTLAGRGGVKISLPTYTVCYHQLVVSVRTSAHYDAQNHGPPLYQQTLESGDTNYHQFMCKLHSFQREKSQNSTRLKCNFWLVWQQTNIALCTVGMHLSCDYVMLFLNSGFVLLQPSSCLFQILKFLF